MAGRNARPIALVDYDNHRTKKEIEAREAGEPKGCTANLTVPKHLSNDAKKEWRRVVKLYRQLDQEVLNDLDVGILACYCESVALYNAASVRMQNEPLTVLTDKGEVVNPLLKIMDKQSANIKAYGEQLCLTPVGRARMGIANAKKEVESDPLEQLLRTGRSG